MRKYAIYLIGRIIPAIIGFLAILLYSRVLEAELYGGYAKAFAVASALNMAIFHWIRVSTTRFLAGTSGKRPPPELGVAMAIYVFLLGASGVTALVLGSLTGEAILARDASVMLAAMALSDFSLELKRASHQALGYSVQYFVRQVAIVGISLFATWWQLLWNPLVCGFALGNLLGFLLTAPALVKLRPTPFRRTDVTAFVRYGLPLSANYTLAGMTNSADRFLAVSLLGYEIGGIYALVADLTRQLILVLMEAINLAAFPDAVRALDTSGNNAARAVLRRNLTLLLAVSIPSAVGLSAIAPSFTAIALGSQFAAIGATLMPYLSLANLLRGLRIYYFDQAFQLAKSTNMASLGTAAALAAMVALTYLLTPVLGALGTALAAVVASAAAVAVSIVAGRRAFPMEVPTRDAVLIMGSAVAMGAIVMVVQREMAGYLGLVTSIAVGGGAYGAGLLLLNVGNSRKVFARHGRP